MGIRVSHTDGLWLNWEQTFLSMNINEKDMRQHLSNDT
jgi:hypothetical protein